MTKQHIKSKRMCRHDQHIKSKRMCKDKSKSKAATSMLIPSEMVDCTRALWSSDGLKRGMSQVLLGRSDRRSELHTPVDFASHFV